MSDETITDEYLDRLQAICDAATAGPWDGVISTGCVRYLGRPMESRGLQHGDYIAAAHGGGDDDPGRDVNNAEFIAESRTALPLLIAEVRRLRGEVDRRSHRIDDLARMLRRCSVALVPPGESDEAITAVCAAVDAPLEDIPCLVSDRIADLETENARLRGESERLQSAVWELEKTVTEVESECNRRGRELHTMRKDA